MADDASHGPPPSRESATGTVQNEDFDRPQTAVSSAVGSIADSISTATPTLGGSNQTQVNVLNREFPMRPSTAERPHPFYPGFPPTRKQTDNDNDSFISRSTAARTNFSTSMGRRPPSRSHIPAIMPAYSFVHPLPPPAVASASAQQQIAPAKEDPVPRPLTSPQDEITSVHGKPSTERLIPSPTIKQENNQLYPVAESSNPSAENVHVPPPTTVQPVNQTNQPRTRNWQHFPGKTKYHLNGRVQFGTQYLANFATATLILIPTGLYFAFTYFPLLTRLIKWTIFMA
jgi:hypothetical protein